MSSKYIRPTKHSERIRVTKQVKEQQMEAIKREYVNVSARLGQVAFTIKAHQQEEQQLLAKMSELNEQATKLAGEPETEEEASNAPSEG